MRRAFSPSAYIVVNANTAVAGAGRPYSMASAATVAALEATCSGVYMYGSHASPNRAARRMAASLRPETQIGGRAWPGRSLGTGCSRPSVKRVKRPS